ncbi:MAG: hypothetical protein VSS75_008865, partial [Candidatus Parabeggiatoa sp.]|nr:hypothetical protein [Candidatus Parabeggiatoa sp.]
MFVITEKINFYYAPILFLSTISRIESVYHIAPILIMLSIYWFIKYKVFRALNFSLIVFAIWMLFHFWRYWYFGDLIPNTAYAQDISLLYQMSQLFSLDVHYLKQSFHLSMEIFVSHGGYLLLLFFPLIGFIKPDRRIHFAIFLLLSFVMTSFLNPYLFGPTRIEHSRTTTQKAVFVILIISLLIFHLNLTKKSIFIAALSLFLSVFIFMNLKKEAFYLGWETNWFNQNRKEFVRAAEKEKLPFPTISNPDLGVMSWHKQFNIVDLGMLGTPIMAKLQNDPAIANYFFEFAAPDLIESHGGWSCRYYNSLFTDTRFRKRYVPIREKMGSLSYCGDKKLPYGIWIRKDILKNSNSNERKLINELEKNLSIDRLAQELKYCQTTQDSNCVYVSRTAYRFLPEFRNHNEIERLNKIFEKSRTKNYDLYLINGYRNGQVNKRLLKMVGSPNPAKAGY